MQEPLSYSRAVRAGRKASRSPARRGKPVGRSFMSFLRWEVPRLLSGAPEAVGLDPQVLPSPQYEGGGDSERTEQYSGKLQQLVLEELRAQLQQKAEAPGQLEWSPVVVDPRKMEFSDVGTPMTLTVVSDTDSGSSQTMDAAASSADGRRPSLKGPGGVKPTDVVLLSDRPVSEVADWQDPGLICKLGVVQELGEEDDGGVGAQIRVDAPQGSPLHARLAAATDSTTSSSTAMPASTRGGRRWPSLPQWHMAVVGNCVTVQRIMGALQEMALPGGSPSRVLRTVLHPEVATLASQHLLPASGSARVQGPSLSHRASMQPQLAQQQVEQYCTQRQLNPSQAQAVHQVVQASVPGSPAAGAGYANVQLIQGPPGTGKTSTIVTTLSVLLGCGCHALMCAPTNVAVQEVAKRLLQLIRASHQPDCQPGQGMFVGPGPDPSAGPSFLGCSQDPAPGGSISYGDVVLLASEERVDESTELGLIWSKARAERLQAALGTASLSSPTAALDSLLSHGCDQHAQLCQRAQAAADSGEPGSTPEEPGPLSTWLRKRLVGLMAQAESFAMCLLGDVPRTLLRPDTAANARALLQAVTDTEHVLGTASDAQLVRAFKRLQEEGSSSGLSLGMLGSLWDTATHIISQATETGLLRSLRHLLSTTSLSYGHHIPPKLLADISGGSGKLERLLLEHAALVFCTASVAGRTMLQAARDPDDERSAAPDCGFHVCIIDEAAQLVEAETAIIMQGFPEVPVMVLVGDPKQLPATVISMEAVRCGYSRSLFERLQACGLPVHMLDTQYRMHPDISRFPSARFYEGRLRDGANVLQPERGSMVTGTSVFAQLGRCAVLDVHWGREEQPPDSSSYVNIAEAAAVMTLLSTLHKDIRAAQSDGQAADGKGRGHTSVGVISPYAAQVEYLLHCLEGVRRPAAAAASSASGNKGSSTSGGTGGMVSWGPLVVEVRSVDGFQGREMDVIILTTVRSNKAGTIGFLQDARRLNVAITRPRHALWVVSHPETLGRRDQVWAALLSSMPQTSQAPVLQQALQKHQQELKRRGDLKDVAADLFSGMLWKIQMSQEFIYTDWSKAKTEEDRLKVLSRLEQLGAGKRPSGYPGSLSCNLVSWPPGIELIHVMPIIDHYLIWTVDVDRRECRQFIKVWGLVHQKELLARVRRLERALKVYTPQYLDRCRARSPGTTRNLVVPSCWEPDPAFVWLRSHHRSQHTAGAAAGPGGAAAHMVPAQPAEAGGEGEAEELEDTDVEHSMLLMRFYPLSSLLASLLCRQHLRTIELQFELSDQEKDILAHQGSAFIQGRSGTGKTTVIMARLMLQQTTAALMEPPMQHAEGQATDAPPNAATPGVPSGLRQLLVTVSPKLVVALKAKVDSLMRTHAHMARLQAAGVQEEGGTAAGAGGQQEGPGQEAELPLEDQLLDDQAVAKAMGGLPNSLAAVTTGQCPLVLPLRHLLLMLEASFPLPRFQQWLAGGSGKGGLQAGCSHDQADDQDEEEEAGAVTEDESASGSDTDEEQHTKTARSDWVYDEVTYERWESSYFNKLDRAKRRGLGDASALWVEIQSVIKGSKEAVQAPSKRLSREEYVGLAGRKGATQLTAEQRHRVYDLYLAYERRKNGRFEWDMGDLTAHLLQQLEHWGFPAAARFHYVYVDEVQDLTVAQLALLKHLCCDAASGYLFAGDTAQTIARGVGFRFQDLRSLFFTDFLSQTGEASAMAPIFQLDYNYRTHEGIVSLASTIVRALTHLFPEAIDRLKPERSHLRGPAPMFILGNDPLQELLQRDLGNTHACAAGVSGCDFGAEQAVLVRDTHYKLKLQQRLGLMDEQILMLTPQECKGLEFQVVLVHGFFSASPARCWRLMYGLLKDWGLLSEQEMNSPHFAHPRFSHQEHHVLISELRSLYVLATRGKQHVPVL